MRKSLFYCIALLIFVIVSFSFSAPVDEWFKQGNKFYEEKVFDSTIEYYKKIIDAGVESSDLYYNLGNAYFRQNNLGHAILYYEKARKINPTDPDILANIKFTRLNIVDRTPEPRRSVFGTILWHLHAMLSLNIQMWVLFFFILFLSLSFTLALFASHNARLWLAYTSALCICISCLLGTSIGIKIYQAEKMIYAIVLEKSVDAKNQPNGTKVRFTVHAGTKFRIRKTVDSWSLVSLPNGVGGWVENNSIGQI